MTRKVSPDICRAVLVAGFGTTHSDALEEGILPCEEAVRRAWPDRTVRRAFTSRGVVRVLRERDRVLVDSPEEAARRLAGEGCRDLQVLPLIVIPGEEYHEKILKPLLALRGLFRRLVIAAPLLSATRDFQEVLTVLEPFIPRDGGLLLMGHGSTHPANAAYGHLQCMGEDRGLPIYLGTVEGYPELPQALRRLKRDGINKVRMMPLMIVAGDHAKNDMAGPDEDSWKSRLIREGFEVEVMMRGLGGMEGVRKIFLRHLEEAGETVRENTAGADWVGRPGGDDKPGGADRQGGIGAADAAGETAAE